MLASAHADKGGVLVVRGEAGIGKTALLEHARNTAMTSGYRVESAAGVESETQSAFAGLHPLCAPLLDRADALPAPQHAALNVAFGLQAGAAPDRFLAGLAVLNLLRPRCSSTADTTAAGRSSAGRPGHPVHPWLRRERSCPAAAAGEILKLAVCRLMEPLDTTNVSVPNLTSDVAERHVHST